MALPLPPFAPFKLFALFVALPRLFAVMWFVPFRFS
jgi:hypothetical protein